MSARQHLDAYLDAARRRLQWMLAARGAAALAAALLIATLGVAWLLARSGFAPALATGGRLVLLCLVLVAAGLLLWRWRALRRDDAVRALEAALPAQSGRIATYLQERAKSPDRASVLLDLLAEDAAQVAEAEPLPRALPARRVWLPAMGAAGAVAAIAILAMLGGALGDAARQLWTGRTPSATRLAAAAGGIAVQPGDATVRRNQDLAIQALVVGAGADVQLHVRFDSGGEWESAPMARNAGGGYDFTLFAVRDGARYYVSAGNLKSAEHRIAVVDLPQIESLKLTYDYPGWTGLARRVEESGGDIRAVAGTRVSVEVVTDAPLEGPLLVINGRDATLAASGTTSRGQLAVREAGHYRIATRFGNEIVPLTPDYEIELVVDEKPDVKIVRPGRDYRATSVEEVPVRVEARDDFRLEALELHYSVNGGEWRSESLPAGSPDIQAAALLRLEELQRPGPRGEAPLLTPGDLVSYYALARDHSHRVQTDLFLIQIQPFEQRYTQSQAGGGGGGGAGGEEEDGDISRKQREILLATWNLQRGQQDAGERDAERAADNARMLAEVQQTLAAQAATLVERAKARLLTGQDENVNAFVKSLEEAAKAMEPAAKRLTEMKLAEAVQHEQQALQHLLRAEASFREIQVAQQNSGRGGGGGGQAGRDVSEMTELELDLAKNQYETEPQMSAQQRSQAEDETMRRLRELARRQEQLARNAARPGQPPEAQRWQQEQLRREAEELRRQLEEMAQQQSAQAGGSQSSGRAGQAQAESAAEAARQVAEAVQQMQGRNDRAGQSRASEQLNRARERLERGREQADRERFSGLAEDARMLADRQRASEEALRAAIGNQPPPSLASGNRPRSGMTFEQMERLSSDKREIQAELETLQRRIETTRRAAEQDAPGASRRLAEARQALEEMDIAGSLARSARDIERGRGAQAAAREALISDSLERLQQGLDEAASLAAGEGGRRDPAREAGADDLLAELGDLRRALERARAEGLARNARGTGEPSARSPDAREGQAGQSGGQQGQQGQGGQGQRGAGGDTPGSEGGARGGADGGEGDFGLAGGGADGGARGGRFIGGLGVRQGVPLIGPGREGLRDQARLSSERLAQLREQLANGILEEADARALQELAQRLRRGGTDPLDAEYQRAAALVNQLELAALRAQQADPGQRTTRTTETVDDSRQYRDNVAEYYRRLGGGND